MQVFWLIIKIIFALALLTGLIALFHPLRFNLRLRAAIKGQRADVLFSYLFGLLKLKATASNASQSLYISVLGLNKLLYSEGRVKNNKPSAQTGVKQPQTSTNANEPKQRGSAAVNELNENMQNEPNEYAKPKTNAEETKQTKPKDAAEKAANKAEAAAKANAEAKSADDGYKADAYPKTSADTSIGANEYAGLGEETGEETSEDSDTGDVSEAKLRLKLRAFKKKSASIYKNTRHYLSVFRTEAKILKPVFMRFCGRIKKGLAMPQCDVRLNYAFSEAYLTGMCQGHMVILRQLLNPLGINLILNPVFNNAPCFYGKSTITAVIYPWRLVCAFAGLLFEKHLYTEGYSLYKSYKKKKAKN